MAVSEVLARYPTLGPPRFTGDRAADAIALTNWADAFHRTLINMLVEELFPRLEAAEAALTLVADLDPLDSGASLADTIAKVNEVIAAAALSPEEEG